MCRTQGIGNAFYGRTAIRQSDNSYVTTQWFVLFLLPIFPLKSFRVIKLDRQDTSYILVHSSTVSYKILEQVSLKNNVKQIIKTYLFTYGILGLFISSWSLLNISDYFIVVPIGFLAYLLLLAILKSE